MITIKILTQIQQELIVLHINKSLLTGALVLYQHTNNVICLMALFANIFKENGVEISKQQVATLIIHILFK